MTFVSLKGYAYLPYRKNYIPSKHIYKLFAEIKTSFSEFSESSWLSCFFDFC